MPTPSTRTPVRIARGSYSNLNSSLSDLQDGEIVYAEDQDKMYIKEGSSLVVITLNPNNATFTGTTTIPTANITAGTVTGDFTFDSTTNAGRDVGWDESDSALEFSVNAKATFGASGELEILNDSSHSYVRVTSGDFRLSSNNLHGTNQAGTEYYFKCTENAAVELYYDQGTHANPKLSTSATGVTIDGTLSATSLAATAASTLAGDLTLNAQKDLRFADADSSNYVGFQAPATVASNVVWTLPSADTAVAGFALTSDGSGNLAWSVMAGGAKGNGGNEVFFENDTTVTHSYTISTGTNASSIGPMTVNSGVVVQIPTGSHWVVS